MQLFSRFPFPRLAGPMLALTLLAGCASPAAYAPRASGQSTGYTDQELTQTRYRITFTGNSVTSRETVENYLLLRAAEVTQAAGYQFFMFDSRDTRAMTRYSAMPQPGSPCRGSRTTGRTPAPGASRPNSCSSRGSPCSRIFIE